MTKPSEWTAREALAASPMPAVRLVVRPPAPNPTANVGAGLALAAIVSLACYAAMVWVWLP